MSDDLILIAEPRDVKCHLPKFCVEYESLPSRCFDDMSGGPVCFIISRLRGTPSILSEDDNAADEVSGSVLATDFDFFVGGVELA